MAKPKIDSILSFGIASDKRHQTRVDARTEIKKMPIEGLSGSFGNDAETVIEKVDPRWVKIAQHLVESPFAIERAERAKNQKLDADNRSFLASLGLSDEKIERVLDLIHERDLLNNRMTMQLMSEGNMLRSVKMERRRQIEQAQDAKNKEIANELGGLEQFNKFSDWEESKPIRDQVAHTVRQADLKISSDTEQRIVAALQVARIRIASLGTRMSTQSRASVVAEQIQIHTTGLMSDEDRQRFITNLRP